MKAVKETVRKYYKYGTTPNATVVGSPTISDGVISGFSSANYYVLPSVWNGSLGNSWEMYFKFKLNNVATRWNGILSYVKVQKYGPRVAIDSSSKLRLYLSTNTSGSTVVNLSGTTILQANIWYWVKCSFTGTQYGIDLSTDGQTYTTEASVSSSTKWTTYTLSRIGIFGDDQSSNYYLDGSIDLTKSYIKIDGKDWWHGTFVEETTEEQAEWYKDVDVYSVPKIDDKYYGVLI